jgi:hypothetical protein
MEPRIHLIILMLIISFTGRAQTIFVDANNTTGTENGTEQHPFNTIKEGINAATQGSTVMIKNGTYIPDDSWSGNDHTLLLKAGLSLVGESRDNTIIAGIVVDQQASNLSIGLENLKFDEFHFIRATHTGPFNDRNIIRNCATTLISPCFGAGIPVNDSTPGPNYDFLIENNNLGNEGIIEFKQGAGISELSVIRNSCGYIYLKSGGGYTYLVDNNDVKYGIFDKSGANKTTISNNRIYNGTIDDLSGGTQYGAEDEIIENNTIVADENSPAFIDEDYKAGITAKSRSATIRNNVITCTGNVSGIRSSAGAPLHIENNTITLDEVQQPNPDPYEGKIGIFNYSGWGHVKGNTIYGGDHGYYSKAGTVEFANNVIENAYTGFYSMGAEEVHHNIIKNCTGDGMILDGLSGPIYNNIIQDNVGSGIRITRVPIDLGGGQDNCPGLNVITGNGNYDLYIETTNSQFPEIYARFNVWDHTDTLEIMQYDIRDGNDSTGLVKVDFTPLGSLGIPDFSLADNIKISPNPCGKIVNIRSEKFRNHPTLLEVFSITGIKMMLKEIPDGNDVILVDVSGLPTGLFFLRFISRNESVTKKLIRIE